MALEELPKFQELRDKWALLAPISKDRIDMQATIDHNANPHNDSYINKKPRRSEPEIISDLAYQFADGVLKKQYGSLYGSWLQDNGYKDFWGTNVQK